MKSQGLTRSLFRFYFIYLYTISIMDPRLSAQNDLPFIYLFQFYARRLPIDLLNFVLGLNRSFITRFPDNPRILVSAAVYLSMVIWYGSHMLLYPASCMS